MKKRLRKVARLLRKNLALAGLWVTLIAAIAIAFPSVDVDLQGQRIKFDGVDLTDLSNGQVTKEFQLVPSLDFYGGTEITYTVLPGLNISDGNAEQETIDGEKISQQLARRLNNSGVSDYDVYSRKDDLQTQIVVELPYEGQKLQALTPFLGSSGKVSFAIQVQPPAPEEGEVVDPSTQQPQFVPVEIPLEEIKSIKLNFGSETRGNGLIVEFTDEIYPIILINAFSNYNSNPESTLFLQIDGQPVAAQSVQLNSAAQNTTMYMTTGLGDDKLATELLKNVITGENLDFNLQAQGAREISGRYDEYLNTIKIISVLALAVVVLGSLAMHKSMGLLSGINLVFVLSVSVAVAKILGLVLSVASLSGLFVALAIWIYHSRSILPILRIGNLEIKSKDDYMQRLSVASKSYRNFLIVVTAVLIALEYSQISALHNFSNYFVISTAVGWLSFIYSIPASVNLIKLNNYGKQK